MIAITTTTGVKLQFAGYRVRRNDGRGAWLATLQPVTWTLNKSRSLIFPSVELSHAAQECCRLNGYYTTATLAK